MRGNNIINIVLIIQECENLSQRYKQELTYNTVTAQVHMEATPTSMSTPQQPQPVYNLLAEQASFSGFEQIIDSATPVNTL